MRSMVNLLMRWKIRTDPGTVKQAMLSTHSEKWKEATIMEMDSCIQILTPSDPNANELIEYTDVDCVSDREDLGQGKKTSGRCIGDRQ